MSLINEALKKAQRQRSGPTDPSGARPSNVPAAAPTPRLPARRHNHVSAQTVVILSIGAVLLFIVGVITTYIFFSADAPPPVIASAPRPVLQVPSAEAPAAVSSPPAEMIPEPMDPPAPEAPDTDPLPVAPSSAARSPATDPVALEDVPVEIPAPRAIVAEPPPAPVQATEVPAGSPVKADPRVYTFLSKIRVAGIRASETDPRVLMNDRMYRLNDLVDTELQLRLTGITSLALTFTDANEIVYTRNF